MSFRSHSGFRQVRDEEKLRTADVDQRRLEVLFSEIPCYEAFASGLRMQDLILVDPCEEEEQAEKQLMEKQNGFLSDKKFVEGSQKLV